MIRSIPPRKYTKGQDLDSLGLVLRFLYEYEGCIGVDSPEAAPLYAHKAFGHPRDPGAIRPGEREQRTGQRVPDAALALAILKWTGQKMVPAGAVSPDDHHRHW